MNGRGEVEPSDQTVVLRRPGSAAAVGEGEGPPREAALARLEAWWLCASSSRSERAYADAHAYRPRPLPRSSDRAAARARRRGGSRARVVPGRIAALHRALRPLLRPDRRVRQRLRLQRRDVHAGHAVHRDPRLRRADAAGRRAVQARARGRRLRGRRQLRGRRGRARRVCSSGAADGGCGCRVEAQHGAAWPATLALLAGLALLLRRRR